MNYCDSPIVPSVLCRETSNDLPREFFETQNKLEPTYKNNLDLSASVSAAGFSTENKENSNKSSLSLMSLIQEISSELSGNRDLNKVNNYMSNYNSSLNEYKRYVFFDKNRKYTRNLIATDNINFTLMLLCWNPDQGSPIHNHSGSECFMRVLEGKLLESQYFIPHIEQNETNNFNNKPQCCNNNNYNDLHNPQSLKLKEIKCLTSGSVAYINDSIGLHKVENIYSEAAITMHLYMPPYDSCKCYSEDTGHTCQAFTTFYSEHGEKVETN